MSNFDKFINKEPSGAKKKEAIRQVKRQEKKERADYFIEKRRQQNEEWQAGNESRPRRENDRPGGKKFSKGKPGSEGRFKKPDNRAGGAPRGTREDRGERPENRNAEFRGERGRYGKPGARSERPERVDRPASGPRGQQRSFGSREDRGGPAERRDRPETGRSGSYGEKRPFGKREDRGNRPERGDANTRSGKPSFGRSDDRRDKPAPGDRRNAAPRRNDPNKPFVKRGPRPGLESGVTPAIKKQDEIMPLNKALALGGISSRREAADIIKGGKVKVNGELILEPGFKVSPADNITAFGKKVVRQANLVYILLNKPKDFLTTSADDQGRKTVLDIVRNATDERIYPVGRLDRNTTGVLLLTNDGDLAQQLSHPKFEIRKVYEARLDKPVTKAHLDQLVQGFELEDGFIAADAAAWPSQDDHSIVGIELHSGRNRIVRRMFEHLGYDVKNLDRVMFANLTKKNVERGKWRFLKDKEVRLLKYFNRSKN